MHLYRSENIAHQHIGAKLSYSHINEVSLPSKSRSR